MALIELSGVVGGYGGAPILNGIDLSIEASDIGVIVGPNGAGKSTILKALSGVLYSEHGEIRSGSILYDGEDCTNQPPFQIVRKGLIQVPEGRQLFDQLTVEENLIVGGYSGSWRKTRAHLADVYDLFPEIKPHRNRISGYLSGGQQQMVAVGRALMGEPRMLLLDEPSLGLAPLVIKQIFEKIDHLRKELGLSVLLVEQNARLALSIADYGYIVERGRVVLDGAADRLLANDDVREFYLGIQREGERRSMRDVKHYKRRKRWLL